MLTRYTIGKIGTIHLPPFPAPKYHTYIVPPHASLARRLLLHYFYTDRIIMAGPFEVGTVLMPLYAIASWYGLYAYGESGRHLLPVAVVGWVWAGINIARTRRLDLGIFTFLLVVIAASYERRYGLGRATKLALTSSSVLVAANYSLVIAFWGEISRDLARVKSQAWMNVFWGYCATMPAYWACVVARNHLRGGETDGSYTPISA